LLAVRLDQQVSDRAVIHRPALLVAYRRTLASRNN